jgi:hypothetical protein
MADRPQALPPAQVEKLRNAGLLHIDALDDHLKAQMAHLDDHEIAALAAIKSKLNSGLSERLRRAADTVGGFVW